MAGEREFAPQMVETLRSQRARGKRNCVGAHISARRSRSQVSPLGSETRIVLDNLRLLVRALRVSARTAEKSAGVSGAQLFVLQTLHEAAVASIGELAMLTHTDQSSVSVVVERLVRRGFVARAESREDARRVDIRLTAAGRGLLRRSPVSTQTRLIAALDNLPREKRRHLGTALGELARAMGIGGEPQMFFEDEPLTRKRKATHVRT